MSADLFAEFGGPSPAVHYEANTNGGLAKPPPTNVPDFNDGQTLFSQQHQVISDPNPWNSSDPVGNIEDDDFGDFEDPIGDTLVDRTRNQEMNVNTNQLGQDRHINTDVSNDFSGIYNEVPIPRPKERPTIQARGPNILFDMEDPAEAMWQQADGNEDEDDFGDFEGVASRLAEPKAVPQLVTRMQQPETMDLLGLDLDPKTEATSRATAPRAPNQTSVRKTTPTKPKKSIITPKPHQPAPEPFPDDTWDDFDTSTSPNHAEPTPEPKDSNPQTPTIAPPTTLLSGLTNPPPSGPPPLAPTNIPPPSVLLPLFPPLITTITKTYLQPLSSLPQDHHQQKQTLLLSPQTSQFLHAYHILATVFAHILAGRRQRWKRDKFLAQSMAIGPSAVSGRSGGGMKLAGVDKGEAGHEDREAVESVRVWKANLGRLRSVGLAFNAAVAAASGSAVGVGAGMGVAGSRDKDVRPLPQVLELGEMMPVRTAKMAEGAVVSLHACALCGLKREERVAKVDVEVEDSFGEWWIEGTNMHLTCFNFWEANKDKLRSR